MSRKFTSNIKEMSVADLDKLALEISEFLVNKTHFSVETLMRAFMVLEVTLALHKVYDLDINTLVFDDFDESIIHRFLMGLGAGGDLSDFETSDLMYRSTAPGYGLGVGCGIALTTQNQTIVVIDDYALNYGTSFESLMQISTYNPNLIIVVIDEENSLLRHYNSMDSFIKSVRISKTYTSIKKDVKNLLSNPVGRPILGTITKFRDELKERIVEPTIFTQFGLQYQGPINGSNLKECIRAFEIASTLEGPQVFHIKTRLRRSFQQTIKFPKFKTDKTVPEGYRTYLEVFDTLLSNRDDITLFVDVIRKQDHMADFAIKYPDKYIMSSGSNNSLIDIMKGYSLESKKCVLIVSASDFRYLAPHLETQFNQGDDVTIILRESGLSPREGRSKQGVYDMTFTSIFTPYIFMGQDVNEASRMLESVLNMERGIRVVRIPQGLVNTVQTEVNASVEQWNIVNEDTVKDPKGVIFTFGPSVSQIANKVYVNDFPIWVINCKTPLIEENDILDLIVERDLPCVVYDVEDISYSLYNTLQNHKALKLLNLNLANANLDLGSKDLKMKHHLRIEDAINLLIRE